MAIGLFCTSEAFAVPVIDVNLDNYLLTPNQSGQVVQLYVSGGDMVTGFNLRAQVGDGLGGNPEPIFQACDFTGGIWDTYPNTVTGGPVVGGEMFAQASVLFSNAGDEVAADGLLVKLTIDTTGIFAGGYEMKLAGTDIGADSDFLGTPASIANGSMQIVPEPASLALIGLGGLLALGFHSRQPR